MASIEAVQQRLLYSPDNTAHGLLCAATEIDTTVFHVALSLEQLQRNAEHLDSDGVFAAASSMLAHLATLAPAIDRIADFFGCGSLDELKHEVSNLVDAPYKRG